MSDGDKRTIDKSRRMRKANERAGSLLAGDLVHQLGRELMSVDALLFKCKGYEVLLVITVVNDESGARMVSFSSGTTMLEALTAWLLKFEAGKTKWRADEPWSG